MRLGINLVSYRNNKKLHLFCGQDPVCDIIHSGTDKVVALSDVDIGASPMKLFKS